MRILIVTQYFYPEQFQINEVSAALVARGHSVTVLTGLPNYPKGEIYGGYEKAYTSEEDYCGVKVIRCNLHPRKSGPLHLILNYLSFCSNATRAIKHLKEDFDIVFAYQLSPVLSAKPATFYAKKNKLPLFLYCLDIWPESAQAQIKNTRSLPYKMIAKLSKGIYSACDHIAVTSRPFTDYLHRQNSVPFEKMSYIPQHSDKTYLDTDFSGEQGDLVHFMYAGNMGKGQVLEVIINAVVRLGDRDDYRVHFVGDGSQREVLESLVREQGLSNRVIFHGNQKREDMPTYYKMADALLLTLRGNNAVGDTMPGKLQAYMSTGKPILAAINGAAAEVIEESACGACVKAGDSEGLAEIMKHYLEHREEYAACGERGRAYFANHFTLDIHVDQLEKQLEKTVYEYNRSI